MYYLIFITFLQLAYEGNAAASDSIVAQAFEADSFVPKVVLNPPNKLLSVTYANVSIVLGTTVTPLQTLTQPQVSYPASNNDLVTLVFFGPDLPPSITPPLTQFLHWLIVNIPGQDITKGDTVSSYFPPVPYPDGLPYIFLTYTQNGRLNVSQIPDLSFILSRPHFAIDDFVKKYNLVGPIAGNFMHESYLEIIPQVLQVLYNIVNALS